LAKNKLEEEWHKKWSLQLSQVVADAEKGIKHGAAKTEDAAKDVKNILEEEWHKKWSLQLSQIESDAE